MRLPRIVAAVSAALLAASGAAMLAPGLYLAALGGSLYYALAGAALLACAALAWRRDGRGPALYGAVFLATLAWSLWEVGLDGWALVPRLLALAAGGLWLLQPGLRRGPWTRSGRILLVACLVAPCLTVMGVALRSQPEAPPALASIAPDAAASGEWPHYGNSLRGTRYSPLAEITAANVASLEPAWTYRVGGRVMRGQAMGNLEVTPLMVEGRLYGCTDYGSVFALDPVTGRALWRHETRLDAARTRRTPCRGVSFFRAASGQGACAARILAGTILNRLTALDAATGAPCPGFGVNGEVDLGEGMGAFPHHWFRPTSPPTIVGGIAVMGGLVADNLGTPAPPGVIRGYDAVTGRLSWAFDPARPQRRALLAAGETYTPSTPNSWTVFAADEALGLVFVPMGNGAVDMVGGQRNQAVERFGSSLVALDARTGAVRWHFQTVHHDLWDYDLPAQPTLVELGGAPALILPTKTGQLFVLDRRTGRPLLPVEERPVPATDVPGERSASTQPYSPAMPDLAGPDLGEADMWGLTPFDQLACRIRFRQARYAGRHTPPALRPTIRMPGGFGGVTWGGAALDPRRGVLVVVANRMAHYDRLVTRAEAEREGLTIAREPNGQDLTMAGTPYALHARLFKSGLGLPCQRPPWGMLTAIDLATRRILWSRPIGDASGIGPLGFGSRLPLPIGTPTIGGPMISAGGLVFVAATQDRALRAIDAASGRTLWQVRLPANGGATPMSYRGRDGRQYVAVAAGGSRGDDAILAYRLPRQRR